MLALKTVRLETSTTGAVLDFPEKVRTDSLGKLGIWDMIVRTSSRPLAPRSTSQGMTLLSNVRTGQTASRPDAGRFQGVIFTSCVESARTLHHT